MGKVGACGVGAYAMFSICEEPVLASGKQALVFTWQGDALYASQAPQEDDDEWTSVIIPMRGPLPVPDTLQFGQFLCRTLTFTQSLQELRVYHSIETNAYHKVRLAGTFAPRSSA